MILADAITCQIATPEAVKVDLINCSTSLIDSAKGVELMWIAIGAIAAFLASMFAARAFWNAQKQLKLAEAQHRYPLLREILDAMRPVFEHEPDSLDSQSRLRELTGEANYLLRMWIVFYPQLHGGRVFERFFNSICAYFDYSHMAAIHVREYTASPVSRAKCRIKITECRTEMVSIEDSLTSIFLGLHGNLIKSEKARNELEQMIARLDEMSMELRELQYK